MSCLVPSKKKQFVAAAGYHTTKSIIEDKYTFLCSLSSQLNSIQSCIACIFPHCNRKCLTPSYFCISAHLHTNSCVCPVRAYSRAESSRRRYCTCAMRYHLTSLLPAAPALWQQWCCTVERPRFNFQHRRWDGPLFLSAPSAKCVCSETLLWGPEIKKVPLNTKHQEKPSSSPIACTRPWVCLICFPLVHVWYSM